MLASTIAAVPSESERTWQEVAASNRERITALERESERTRDALHEIRASALSTRYLAEKIADLASDVRDLAARVETVARHAVQRPSPTGLAVLGQYLGLGVAVVALIIAVTR